MKWVEFMRGCLGGVKLRDAALNNHEEMFRRPKILLQWAPKGCGLPAWNKKSPAPIQINAGDPTQNQPTVLTANRR